MAEIQLNSTYNMDIGGLVRRLDRIVVEITKSQSSPLTMVREADFARIGTYIAEAQSYADYAARKPELDFPKTHGVPLALPEAPVITGLENDSLWDLAQLFDSARFEMANSASSRAPSGLTDPDKTRFDSYMKSARVFMDEHIAKVLPLDLPESAPSVPVSPQGALGV